MTIVETIYDAQKNAHEIEKVTDTHGKFSIPEAYGYQAELIDRFVAEGSVISGYKMGLTSREKMVQMGIDAPIHGVLLEEMLVKDGKLCYDKLIHPKAEPEVAVKMKQDVPAGATIEQLEAAIGWIAPAIEIIDSRFLDFKFTMADVVADNCSSSGYAVGQWVQWPAPGVDLDDIHVAISVNGEEKASGRSDAVLGSQMASLYELHQALTQEGKQLKAGQVILTGAVTAAFRIFPGDVVSNTTDKIGTVTFQ